MALEINPQFEKALNLLKERDGCLFITGKAGTGKSTLLEHFSASASPKPVVLAPTGVAALNVQGQTIHSFFNFYIDVTTEKVSANKYKPRNPKLYENLSTIIIDEVSMLRADLLDCIDMFLRMYGPVKGRAFGGVKMVFVGDLFQLPPVVQHNERAVFESHYQSPYFFSARVFSDIDLKTVELTKVYRQKEQEFVDLLNRIRNNSIGSSDLAIINSRLNTTPKNTDDSFCLSLCSTNQRAQEINDQHLSSLPKKGRVFNAEITGTFGSEYFPTQKELELRVGAQIMLLNNDPKKRYVNGSVGVIEEMKMIDGEDVLCVRLENDGLRINVSKYVWEVIRFKVEDNEIKSELAGTFTQFPVRLAWAITIHKSQGKTFDSVILDIGRGTFAPGQLYVALSRCRTFEKVALLTKIERHHIRTDPRISQFLSQTISNRA